ncbi:MAG: DUF456 domain-containing protein [Cytophagales bacterium]|nr:DUF456 domain-containing protein [Cytophagales bacterium]
METFLLILAVLLLAGGIIFSVLPPIPGPLLAYLGMISTHYATVETSFSTFWLIFFGVVTALILVIDFILPVAATKKFGGTKAGIWGGIIGTVLGVILPIPFGIILGPLLGAIIGDLIGGNHIRAAMKSGFGSFLGFLLATSIKVIFSCIIGVLIFVKIGGLVFDAIMDMF